MNMNLTAGTLAAALTLGLGAPLYAADNADGFVEYCESSNKSKAANYTISLLAKRAGSKDCAKIESAISKLDKLILNDDNLADVRALRFFDFKSLFITSKKAIKLSKLAGMHKLERIMVSAPISYLPVIGDSVESISIINGKSLDIESVAEYENLTELSFIKTSIDDLQPIRSANKLSSLKLQECGLLSLDKLPLSNNLRRLYIAKNQLIDVEDLARLNKLVALDISGNNVTSLKPLAKMKDLKWLNVSFNPIDSGFAALEKLTKVTYLSITDVGFRDFKAIKGMTKLGYLFIGGNEISDLSPLKTYGIAPGTLGFRDNRVTSLAPLADLTGIQRLYANNNKISDLSGLPAKINTLDLSDNDIETLAGIDKLTKLKYFVANNNNIISLRPLKKATLLSSLKLDNNKVRSLAPLKDLENISGFSLEKNPLGVDLPKTASNCPTDAKSKAIAEWCAAE